MSFKLTTFSALVALILLLLASHIHAFLAAPPAGNQHVLSCSKCTGYQRLTPTQDRWPQNNPCPHRLTDNAVPPPGPGAGIPRSGPVGSTGPVTRIGPLQVNGKVTSNAGVTLSQYITVLGKVISNGNVELSSM